MRDTRQKQKAPQPLAPTSDQGKGESSVRPDSPPLYQRIDRVKYPFGWVYARLYHFHKYGV